ncbi:hypothetical protein NP493_1847g00032 [Ridgeia piscesae]|uniref:Uncharacterized protein n=1 Tax=Ridgeia piscesae TaxID=27915 RepID=A0AAD9JSM0_RIDPI|nr:hypothetical protein NP493_1847g00032 [Ridgeia piscesae]
MDPTGHGWELDHQGILLPRTVPTGTLSAPAVILHLIHCNCKTSGCLTAACSCSKVVVHNSSVKWVIQVRVSSYESLVLVPRTSHSYEYMTHVVVAKQSSRESCASDVIRKQQPSADYADYRSQVDIPYVEGVSERVHRVMKKYGVATAVRPHTTLRRLLVHPQDKVELAEEDHATTDNHIKGWEGAKIIDKEPNKRTRQVKEAIWIRKTKTQMNRDEGKYEIPHVYDDVICH